MRRREYLIEVYGASTLSLHGMARCPWRKGKAFSVKPAGMVEPHPAPPGHSGDRPPGKLPRSKRIKAGLPGTPSGICLKKLGQSGKDCYCGSRSHGGHDASRVG